MPEAVPRLPRRVSGFRALAGRRSLGPRVFRVGEGWNRTRPESKAAPSPPPPSAPSCATLCFFLFAFLRRSPRTRVVRDGFELAIFLPPRRECCSDRRASPCPVDAMLGAEPSPAFLFQCSHYSPGRQGWSGARYFLSKVEPQPAAESCRACRAASLSLQNFFFHFGIMPVCNKKLTVLTFWGCAQKVASCIALYNRLYHICWKLSSFHTDTLPIK